MHVRTNGWVWYYENAKKQRDMCLWMLVLDETKRQKLNVKWLFWLDFSIENMVFCKYMRAHEI
jgi:hypothetical protein